MKQLSHHLSLTILHLVIILHATYAKLFESKAAKAARLAAAKQAQIEKEQFYTVFGILRFDKTGFYTIVSVIVVICLAIGIQCGVWWGRKRTAAAEAANKLDKLDVVIVGSLQPHIGFGWLHLTHFLNMTTVNVRAVVDSQCSTDNLRHTSFADLISSLFDIGVECVKSVSELQGRTDSTKLLCVIAGKAHDNPRYFRECINIGATHIYLEPPGAPSSLHLRDMASLAQLRKVQVYMGYHRGLCSSYIKQALEFSRSIPRSHIFFCHNEGYSSKTLPEVVTQQPEGLMLSVACQELAVLVSQYKMNAGDVLKFKVNTNPLFTETASFVNSDGQEIIDLIRVAFKITSKKGKTVSVMADRCGGLLSFAVVKSHRGEELKKFQSMTTRQVLECEGYLKREGSLIPNFIVEKDDYLELKRRVVENIIINDGDTQNPEGGLLSIGDGIDVMMLAEYCSVQIDNALPPVE